MSSERLPGKVLLPVGGVPLVKLALDAAAAARNVDDVVVATSTAEDDDVLASYVEQLGWPVHRGPRDDVLTRFVGVLESNPADVVVRLTADDPLLDPDVIDTVVESFLSSNDAYVSNILERSWPRGLDTEVISREALLRSDELAREPAHREHVTLFARMHPELFSLGNVTAPPTQQRPALRLCIDTVEDHAMLDHVVGALYQPGETIGIDQVLAWLDDHPEIASLNAEVSQRAVFGKEY